MNINGPESVDSRGFTAVEGRGCNCFLLPPLLRCPAAKPSLMFPDFRRGEKTRRSQIHFLTPGCCHFDFTAATSIFFSSQPENWLCCCLTPSQNWSDDSTCAASSWKIESRIGHLPVHLGVQQGPGVRVDRGDPLIKTERPSQRKQYQSKLLFLSLCLRDAFLPCFQTVSSSWQQSE